MGTGGPSPSSTPTILQALQLLASGNININIVLYINPLVKDLFQLVTRTGFEPMLPA